MKTLGSKKVALGVLGVLVLTLGLAAPGPAAEGIWTKKADMPTARMLLGACVVNGKIYAVGGSPAPHVDISAVAEYDPGTNTWMTRAPMPTPRAGLGVSAVSGKIYAIGGSPPGARTVEEYDPATDTWRRKADMPTGRDLLTTSVVNGKIYAIGGAMDTSGPAFKTVEEYDPATNTWTRKADLPEPRYLHAATVVDGKVYIIAGSWQAGTASRAVYAYDPATDTWEQKADAPTARSWLSGSASEADGRIYVIGGDFGPPKSSVEEYDPLTDIWVTRPAMPTPRGALSTAALNGKIYVLGGTITLFNDVLSTVEEYTPNPLVVDFNGDGIVDLKDLLRLIESWGQGDPTVDIGPRPLGDGIIDAADLEILMDYWGQEVPDPTLLIHWALDETTGTTAADSAGGSDALVLGSACWQAEGRIGGALAFDGKDDFMRPGKAILDPGAGPFSIMAWVRGGAPGRAIVSQASAADWLYLNQYGMLTTDLKASGRSATSLTSDAYVLDDQWHRVVLTWDGTNRALYMDGAEVKRDTQPNLAASSGNLLIGAGKTLTPASFWTGLIDDVRVYNRAVAP